ncbi:MAG: ABC transporter permease [Longimicrobiales bacterium]
MSGDREPSSDARPRVTETMDADSARKAPGTRIVAWLAPLVPAYRRAEWLAEWRSELSHSFDESRAEQAPRAWSALRLRVRAAGAVRDALWLRRAHGGRSNMRETLRDATRVLRRQPGFALMVVGTLALGIGAATAIFSAIDGLMLRPLPFRDLDQLVEVRLPRSAGLSPLLSLEEARVWRERDDVFGEVRMYGFGRSFVLTGRGEPRSLGAQRLEPGFLSFLGLRPALGREFVREEAVPGRDRVVMLSAETWRTVFGSDPSVVGGEILLNQEPYTVVGVVPRDLPRLPTGFPDIFMPLTDPLPAGLDVVAMLGRVRADVPRAVAQSRLDAAAAYLDENQPREESWAVRLTPMVYTVRIETRRGLETLAGAVTFLLLVACINAAGLLFVRGVARRTEMTIRGALGGTGGQLFRESLAESMLLALLAGIGGTLIAWWGVRALVAIAPENLLLFSYNAIEMDARVLTFALLLTALTGLAFGITPALRAARAGSFTAARRAVTAERGETRLRSVVQALQIALAVVLLTGAGLLGRSFVEIMRVDPGFDPADLLVVSYGLPSARYPDQTQRGAFHRAVDKRLRALPGVEAVSWNGMGVPPRIGYLEPVAPEAEGGTTISASRYLPFAMVDSAYFSVLRIPIVQGRTFSATDLLPDASSVIIDIDLANALWPDGQAVGKRFRAGPEREWVTVVGVTGDMKLGGVDDALGDFALFQPTSIDKLHGPQLAIRTTSNAAALPGLIRETIHELDALLPIEWITSAEELLRESIQERRFVLTTMTTFAVIALVLAMIGVYGLVAFAVARRTREIGIRKAIGAGDGRIVSLVFARGLAIAGGGLVIGLLATVAASRLLTALLFGVPRHDPITLVIVTLALLSACSIALIVPARRAARIDAASTLRME